MSGYQPDRPEQSGRPGQSGQAENGKGEEAFDVERALAVAMTEYVDRVETPVYVAASFGSPGRSGRGKAVFGLAAAAVLAVAGGVAVLAGQGGSPKGMPVGPAPSSQAVPGTPSAPPAMSGAPLRSSAASSVASSAPSSGTSTTSPSASSSGKSATLTPDEVVRKLVVAAELYGNPATRAKVDVASVAALFRTHTVFQTFWGSDGTGVMCGARADGATANGSIVTFYQGARLQPQTAIYDVSGGLINGVTCSTSAGTSKANSDPVVGYYGGLVAIAGDITAQARQSQVDALGSQFISPDMPVSVSPGVNAPTGTCGTAVPHSWYADEPGAGTTGGSWKVSLDGGPVFEADFGAGGSTTAKALITVVLCR